MQLNVKEKRIHVRYPLKPTAYQQRSNYGQAVTVHSNIEKSLIKDNLVAYYKIYIKKAIEAGSVVELSDK